MIQDSKLTFWVLISQPMCFPLLNALSLCHLQIATGRLNDYKHLSDDTSVEVALDKGSDLFERLSNL